MITSEDFPPEPTGDEAAFLAEITGAPEDDLSRLVYADWLDECGRPDEATAIRAEVEWSKCERLAREAGLRARESFPAKAEHFRRVNGPLYNELFSSRGLADTVRTSVARFVRHGPRLFRTAPITAAVFPRIAGQVAELAVCPLLARLTDLQLVNPWWQEDVRASEFAPLCRSPHVGGLRRLRFCGCQPFSLRALSESDRLGGLRVLYVDQCRLVGLNRGGALGGGLAGLISLNLWGTPLREADVQVLANSPTLGRVEHLGLLGTELTAAGVTALVKSKTLNSLRYLEIGDGELGDVEIEPLRARPGLTILKSIINTSGNAPSWDEWPSPTLRTAETVWARP